MMIKQTKNKIIDNSACNFSVAPMLDWTDKHCRYFHRQLTQKAWLYSEMVTTGAIIYGEDLPRFLDFNLAESPVVLQLGGSDPKDISHCAKLAQEWGYSEVNLNVGCPSDRVQNNLIGACLMGHPELVADNVKAMKDVVDIPVTVKSRIGIDEQEDFATLEAFVGGLVDAGVDGLILHARKAWLQGLSPKENRDVPPLRYDWVHRIKAQFPTLSVAINGGLKSLESGKQHLEHFEFENQTMESLDGVMMGRAVYEQPYLLSRVDSTYYQEDFIELSRESILDNMYPYIDSHLSSGGKLNQISRHMLGLFYGLPGGRMWRRYISENAFKQGAGIEVLQQAHVLVANEQKRMADKLMEIQSKDADAAL